jgi:signal transduction histidine kinase
MTITLPQRLIISFALLFLIGYLDSLISVQLNSAIFYLIPIIILSYQKKLSQNHIVYFCILAGIIWGIVDFKTHEYTNQLFFFINWLSRFVLFMLTGIYYSRLTNAKEQRRTIATQKKSLEEANTKLLQLNSQLNKFIGVAAHDIRNPVGNIQMMSELILEDNTISESSKGLINMIHKSSKNALYILSDTLNISQIESGTIKLNLTKSDYLKFIKETIAFNEQLAKRKNQTINVVTSLDSIVCTFDESRTAQVINNLVTNALKYSEFNTTIIIRVGYLTNEKQEILTEVLDQGMGIDEKFHDKIFEPFIMTNNIPTNNESKTGLGLAISKKIVELHHGKIDFTSEKGKGSNFFFTLPI